jgi:hypothetical protein
MICNCGTDSYTQLPGCQEKLAYFLRLSELFLSFLAMEMMGYSAEMTVAWFLPCTGKSKSLSSLS